MFREKCRVLANEKVAPGHFVLRFASTRIGHYAKPGQFVQILCDDSFEPLLPRPFSFLTASKKEFSVLYQVVGKGTLLLSKLKKEDLLWVTGPLGNGFDGSMTHKRLGSGGKYLLVGGGVGIPPLFHLAETLVKNKFPKTNIHVFLGARNKSLLLCEKEFKKLGVKLDLATDDGSKGRKGLVTALLKEQLKSQVSIYTCGPTPMLKAVSKLAQEYRIPCEVSVEVPMACGFGACLGCAIKVKQGEDGHRFAVACCEGPVFQGKDILWD